MACYHPLKAFQIGLTDNGKKKLKIVPYSTDHIELCNGVWEPSPYEFRSQRAVRMVRDHMVVPCGQCSGCRMQRSREWANRCMLELKYHDSAFFVTLTYDDFHVPKSYYGDPESGEAMTSLTLKKRDFQLFMKRLRKKFSNDSIRFFMAGEYGGQTFRPHYHAIIFGLHLDDLSLYKKSPQGFSYYNSPSLQSCWCDKDGVPIGFAVAAEVTWETCAYTARYVMKKLIGDEAKFYTNFNLEPPFTLMSRKPGIARQYYEDHPEIYEKEYINVSTEKGGIKFRPPRYYDRLFDLDHPEEMQAIKNFRQKLAVEAQKAKLAKTSLSDEQYFEVQERAFENKIKSLRRPLE